MKKNKTKKAIAMLAIASIIFLSGCATSGCSGMKYHQRDVKMGLAH